jgi:hypothetical protein
MQLLNTLNRKTPAYSEGFLFNIYAKTPGIPKTVAEAVCPSA